MPLNWSELNLPPLNLWNYPAWIVPLKKQELEMDIMKEEKQIQWVNVTDKLPETKPSTYETEMSEIVLVRGIGKYEYPWLAHLHKDNATTYGTCVYSFEVNGAWYVWLNPRMEADDRLHITQWAYLPISFKLSLDEQVLLINTIDTMNMLDLPEDKINLLEKLLKELE